LSQPAEAKRFGELVLFPPTIEIRVPGILAGAQEIALQPIEWAANIFISHVPSSFFYSKKYIYIYFIIIIIIIIILFHFIIIIVGY